MKMNVKGFFLVWMLFGLFALGCGGDGSTLGPDGAPIADADGGDDGDGVDEGDGGDGGDGGPVAITLAQLSAEIFTPSCAVSGCHSGGAPAAGMNLSAGVIAGNIIGVSAAFYPGKRIDVENPDESVILKKLRGDGSVSTQMPLTGSPLSADQIAMISDWIAAGAPTD